MPDIPLIQDGDLNGDGTPRDDEPPDYAGLFTAPDLAQFVKLPKTKVAREYEQKVKALLKAGMVASINVGNMPDAATFLYYAASVSAAAGTLADQDKRIRSMIDVITTPANPYAMFVMTALPFIAQLMRNHEDNLRDEQRKIRSRWQENRLRRKTGQPKLPKPEPKVSLTLPFIRKRIAIRFAFPVGKILRGFRSQTQPPEKIAFLVFSDEKVVAELQKQGIGLRTPE